MSQQLRRPLVVAAAFLLAPHLAHATGTSGSAFELLGNGVQIYACTTTPAGVTWALKAPEAALSDTRGEVVGHHFAGPTWQAADDSKVVGALVIGSKSPDPAAIPWLLLQATAHQGAGVFAEVAYIARTHTSGGLAPRTGCDATHQGDEARIPYSATYTFFTSAP